MSAVKPYIRRGRFSISRYQFLVGGEMDVLVVDFINDPSRGLGVPARSLSIFNHAGGNGNNFLYYRTCSSGKDWDDESVVMPDCVENWEVADNAVFSQAQIWSSNPNLVFSLRAAPGEWTQGDYREYVVNPAAMKESEILENWKTFQVNI
jgi:hypothetical protein